MRKIRLGALQVRVARADQKVRFHRGPVLFPLPQAVLFLSWWSRSRRSVPCGWLAGWLVLSVCRSRQFPPHIMSIQGMWVSIHDVPRPSILILVMVQPHPSPSAA